MPGMLTRRDEDRCVYVPACMQVCMYVCVRGRRGGITRQAYPTTWMKTVCVCVSPSVNASISVYVACACVCLPVPKHVAACLPPFCLPALPPPTPAASLLLPPCYCLPPTAPLLPPPCYCLPAVPPCYCVRATASMLLPPSYFLPATACAATGTRWSSSSWPPCPSWTLP